MKFGGNMEAVTILGGARHDRDLRLNVEKTNGTGGMTTCNKAQANTSRPEEATLRLPDPGHNLPRDGEPPPRISRWMRPRGHLSCTLMETAHETENLVDFQFSEDWRRKQATNR